MIKGTSPVEKNTFEPQFLEFSNKNVKKSEDILSSSGKSSSTTLWEDVKYYVSMIWYWIKYRLFCCFFDENENLEALMYEEIEIAYDKITSTNFLSKKSHKTSRIFHKLSNQSQERIKYEMRKILKKVNFQKLTPECKKLCENVLNNLCDSTILAIKSRFKKLDQILPILRFLNEAQINEFYHNFILEIITNSPQCNLVVEIEEAEKNSVLIFYEAINNVLLNRKPFI